MTSTRSRAGRVRLSCLLLALAAGSSAAGPEEDQVTRYFAGSGADVSPPLFGPTHVLEGGGGDVDGALQLWIDEIRGCSDCDAEIDIVVLRASGSDGYNDYLDAMNGVDSVDTWVITGARGADLSRVEAAVRDAEAVFFAGGDQCRYVTLFKGTPIEDAIESVYARGGGVGGISAGLAIQGEYVYDACTGSETSEGALADPYDEEISFTYDFFAWPYMKDVITDTHVDGRDRLGRSMTFLARQLCDGVSESAWALAVSEATAAVVDSDGVATVMGEGAVYFILADHAPETCEPARPLTYSGFKVWKVTNGDTFDLAERPSSGFYRVDIDEGVVSPSPY